MLRNWALALRPSLSLDFLAGLNDSRITYSGGANGTRVNSSGLIVAATTPRFDYNPVTLAARGLLVEEARTNLLTYSQELDNAAWLKTEATVTANAVTSPDGTQNADKIVESSAAASQHSVYQSTSGLTDSAVYTHTVYLKAAERTKAVVVIMDKSATSRGMLFDLSAGTVSSYNADGITDPSGFSIENAGNGWYRCRVSQSVGTGGFNPRSWTLLVGTTSIIYNGNGTSGIYAWGAQTELGSFPTSYIPTTSASVTRTADSAVMTGTNFSSWYNQSEGTFVVAGDLALPANGNNQFLARASDNSYNNSTALNCNATGFGSMATASGGVFDGNASVGNAFTANAVFKAAGSYKTNALASCVNAGTVATDSSATIPSALTRLDLGADHAGANHIGSGHLRSITYYPSRLSNEQLQALTS